MGRLALLVAALVLAPRPGAASVAVARSLGQLVAEADLVVDAVSDPPTSRWESLPDIGERIVTYTSVTVSASVGASPRRLRVRTLGGRVGDIVQRVFGQAELRPGARQLLFLRRSVDDIYVVVSGAEGAYTLERSAGGTRLRPGLRGVQLLRPSGLTPAVDRLTGMDLPQALRLVRDEWSRLGRR